MLDDDTAGIVVLPSDGSTVVVAGDTTTGPGPGDDYTVRLTRAPTAPVTVAILADGQLDVVIGGRVAAAPAGSGWAAAVTFDASNWWIPVTVRVVADPAFVPAPGSGHMKSFPKQPHLLGELRGPLSVEGGTSGVDRSLQPAILLPGEANAPLIGIGTQPPESGQIDVLNVFDDSSLQDQTGVLTATTITGFDMAAGITYAAGGTTTFEVVNLFMGQGNDHLTISGTLVPGADLTTGVVADHGGLTTVHGGGNSLLASGVVGGDTIVVTGGAGPGSPLVVYGDTSQDGVWYSGDPNRLSLGDFGPKPFPTQLGSTPRFIFPLAGRFDRAGNDVIDARSLFAAAPSGALPTVGLTVYGGAGDDTITGSQAGDFLAGGSGNDRIDGGRGIDQLYGDSGVNVDVLTRVLTIPTTNASSALNADGLVAGRDELHGDGAASGAGVAVEFGDVIFGDHGAVIQDVDEPGNLAGPEPQKIQTTLRIVTIETREPLNGADDVITGDLGIDRILGGNGNDRIDGNAADDLVLGDHGRIHYPTPDSGTVLADLLTTTDPEAGGVDTINGNDGNDVILGGTAGDTVSGDAGNDLVFGDHGRADRRRSPPPCCRSACRWCSTRSCGPRSTRELATAAQATCCAATTATTSSSAARAPTGSPAATATTTSSAATTSPAGPTPATSSTPAPATTGSPATTPTSCAPAHRSARASGCSPATASTTPLGNAAGRPRHGRLDPNPANEERGGHAVRPLDDADAGHVRRRQHRRRGRRRRDLRPARRRLDPGRRVDHRRRRHDRPSTSSARASRSRTGPAPAPTATTTSRATAATTRSSAASARTT